MAWLIPDAEPPVTCRSVCLHGLVSRYRHLLVQLFRALSKTNCGIEFCRNRGLRLSISHCQ